ncbi:MAG TPA: DUF1232 domain-containing protein [Actinomycetota bacterium]|nr:DUF1232 domain-containing protein [Actinomycetota bacterium]
MSRSIVVPGEGAVGVAIRILIAVTGALLVAWAALILYVWAHRPTNGTARMGLRLLPDAIRLVRRIAADRSLAPGVRIRLWLLLLYLASPVDLVPDFLPIIGYADDVVIVAATLRSVVRRAGSDAIRRHWPGTPEGLAALWRLAGLPGEP